MTPLDLITLALKASGIVGVGQVAQAEDATDAFTLLNMMLGQWNRRRWLVFHLKDASAVSTGAASYTIGAGGDFDVPRPDRIESAYLRLLNNSGPNQPDYQLALLPSMEDYSRITLKGMMGYPSYAFLDSDYPLGTLHFWPVPTAGIYELHVLVKAELPGFSDLSDDVNLPPEYQEAIMYNLAARLRPHYQLPPDPSVVALAKSSLNTVRISNAQVATLLMPAGLHRRGNYNVITDEVY
jgi:hypothetical protein